MDGRATRRSFLSAVGLTGVGLGVAPAAGAAQAASHGAVPFYGPHQAGIATRSQQYVHFLALDVVSSSASDLQGVLRTLSRAAAAIAGGHPVGPMNTGYTPPMDTGEQVGHPIARATVTIGLGPALFAPRRFGR